MTPASTTPTPSSPAASTRATISSTTTTTRWTTTSTAPTAAGTVAGGLNNGGVVGVAPNVSLPAVKVLDAEGSGTYEAVANGIIFAADQGAQIISMSLGGPPRL